MEELTVKAKIKALNWIKKSLKENGGEFMCCIAYNYPHEQIGNHLLFEKIPEFIKHKPETVTEQSGIVNDVELDGAWFVCGEVKSRIKIINKVIKELKLQ